MTDLPWDATYMGIDQSLTSTGYCVADKNGNVDHFDTFETEPQKDVPLHDHIRCNCIAQYAVAMARQFQVDTIFIEGLSFNGPGNSGRQLAGLQYVIIDHLMCAGFTDIRVIAPNQVKRLATGKGNAKKDEMFAALPQNMQDAIAANIKKKSHNDVCDAYWLSQMANYVAPSKK